MIREISDWATIGAATAFVAVGNVMGEILPQPVSLWKEWLPMLRGLSFIAAIALVAWKIHWDLRQAKKDKDKSDE